MNGDRIKPSRHRIIITGPVQSGKSSLIWALVEKLDALSIPLGGFVAKGLWQNNRRAGFDLIDLNTRIKIPLARRDDIHSSSLDDPGKMAVCQTTPPSPLSINGEGAKTLKRVHSDEIGGMPEQSKIPYTFFEKGMAMGMASLQPDACGHAKVIVVDEIGKLEMRGHGWAPALSRLMALKDPVHIWIVRDFLVDAVCKRWPFDRDDIIGVDDPHPLEKLLKQCTKGV